MKRTVDMSFVKFIEEALIKRLSGIAVYDESGSIVIEKNDGANRYHSGESAAIFFPQNQDDPIRVLWWNHLDRIEYKYRSNAGTITTYYRYPIHSSVYSVSEFRDGLFHGLHLAYDSDGNKIVKSHYCNGELHGTYTEYFQRSGQNFAGNRIKETIDYYHGNINGKKTLYYKNGTIREIIEYKNNKKHGSHLKYLKNGKMWKKVTYKNGKFIHGEQFHPEPWS